MLEMTVLELTITRLRVEGVDISEIVFDYKYHKYEKISS